MIRLFLRRPRRQPVLRQVFVPCLGCGGWYRSAAEPHCHCTDKH